MQRLTMMTIGAAFLGLAGFAYDSASAQAPGACSTRAVDIYFDRGSTALNTFSQQLVERLAEEARNCGSSQVVVSAAAPDRARAVLEKFQSLGVKATVLAPQAGAPSGESVAGRAVTIRLAGLASAVG